MGDIELPATASHPAVPAYFASAPAPTRGVVVIHEIFGLTPEIRDVVDRFAAAGYAAVAPDLYATQPRALCIARAFASALTGRGPAAEQIRSAHNWLCERAALPKKSVGVIGFCFGGGFALVAGHEFGAVSANYGLVPTTAQLAGLPPVIACYAGRDLAFRQLAPILERRLTRALVPHELHMYPEAGHSFCTNGDHPVAAALLAPLRIEYDATAAEDAFKRIFAFFAAHLETGLSP